jgi:hypothetical protein
MELASEAANSFGNAEANQEKYANSVAGILQSISTEVQSFWLNFINSDLVFDGLTFVQQLVKSLSSAFSGGGVTSILAVLGGTVGLTFGKNIGASVLKGIVSTITEDLPVALQMGQNGSLFTMGDAVSKVAEAAKAGATAEDIAKKLSGLNVDQQKMVLKSTGVGGELGNQVLSQAASMQVGSAAVDASKVKSLSNAYSGLAAALGLSTKALTAFLGVAAGIAAISVGIAIYQDYKNKLEEAKNAAVELGNEFDQLGEAEANTKEKIIELREVADSYWSTDEERRNAKNELLEIQNKLIESYGKEAEGLDLVTGSIEAQTNALSGLTKEKWVSWGTQKTNGHSNEDLGQQAYDLMNNPYSGYEQGYLNPTTRDTTGSDLTEVLEEIQGLAKAVGLDITAETSYEQGQANILGYKISSSMMPQETKTALASLIEEVDKKRNNLSLDDPTKEYYDVLAERLGSMKGEVDELIESNAELANDFKMWHLATNTSVVGGEYEGTPYDLLYDYKQSITDYQEVLASGEEETIKAAKEHYETLDAYVDELIKNDSHSGEYSSLFTEPEQTLQNTTLYKKRQFFEEFKPYQYSSLGDKGYTNQDLLSYAQNPELSQDIISSEDIEQMEKLVSEVNAAGLSVSDVIDDFVELGVVIKEVGAPEVKDLTFSQTIKNVSTLQESLTKVTALYKQIESDNKDGKFTGLQAADFDTIQETFGSAFGTDTMSQWLTKLQEANTDAEKLKSTLKDMMVDWVGVQDPFKKAVDDGDIQELTTLLQSLGLTIGSLTAEQEKSVDAQVKLAGGSDDLARNIDTTAQALVAEAEKVGATSTAYNALYIQKLVASKTIDFVSGDLQQLNTIMQGLGLGRQAWVDYYNAKANYETMSSVLTAGDEASKTDRAKVWATLGTAGYKGNNLEDGLEWYNKEYLPSQEQILIDDLQDLSKLNVSNIDPTVLSPDTSSGGSTADPEAVEWQERRIKYLEKEHNLLTKIYEDEKELYTERRQAYSDAIGWDQQQIQAYTESKNNWKKLYEDNLSSVIGLTDTEGKNPVTREMIEGIQSGVVAFDAGKYAKDDYDKIKEVLEYYDSFIEADEKILDLEKEISEHRTAIVESRIQEIEQVLTLQQTEASMLSTRQSMAETTGQLVTEDDYKKMIRNSKSQISSYYDEIDVYEEYLDELEEGSEEYAEVENKIASCNNAILEARAQQAEWNEEIKKIPITRLESYLSSLSRIKALMENMQSEVEAIGGTLNADQIQTFISLDSEELEARSKQLAEYQKLINSYEWGSTKYEETESSMQEIESSISSIVTEMTEWNKQILNLPIDKLTESNEKLSTSIEALTEQEEDYNTAIDAVTSSIDEKIDAINKERDATEEYYDDQIEKIQDVVDALEEENELRDKRLAVEEAEYDLNKAMNQRNVAVIDDNGQTKYIADEDSVRQAQNDLDEAQYAYKIYLLQQEIEKLEDERDELLEQYDDQIEALEDISEKWEKITSNIQLAKDQLVATNYLGEGWLNKVLTGNDQAIFDKFVVEYKENDDMLTAAQDMLDSNNRIITLLQAYVDDYMAGKVSYEEAFANIKAISGYITTGLGVTTNLEETLSYLKGEDFKSFLGTLSSAAQEEADKYGQYLAAVQKNSDYMEDYQVSLNDLSGTISENIKALKASYEAATNQTVATNTLSRTIAAAANISVQGEGVSTLGDAYVHHSGINTGYIGASTSDEKLEALKAMTLSPLKPDEMPALLQAGEIVLNRSQQDTLLSNIKKLGANTVNPVIAAAAPKSGTVVNMTLSNLTFHEIQNGQDFANYITKNLSSAIAQASF